MEEKYNDLENRINTLIELYIKLDEKVSHLSEIVASLDSEFEDFTYEEDYYEAE